MLEIGSENLVSFGWQYAEKVFVRKPRDNQNSQSVAQQIWEAVRANDKKAVYRLIVHHDADVSAVYEQASGSSSLTLAKALLLQEQTNPEHFSSYSTGNSLDRSSTSSLNFPGSSEGLALEDLDGCALLHLACETSDIGMLELLLQYGANINSTDSRGQTPLHRCILRGRPFFAKLLLSRWILLIHVMSWLHYTCAIQIIIYYLWYAHHSVQRAFY